MASYPNEEAYIAPSTTVGGTPQSGGHAMNTADAVSVQARRSFDMAVQNALMFSDRRSEYAVDMAFRAYAGKNYEQFRTTALAQGIQQAAGFLVNGPMAGMFGGSAQGLYSGVSSSIGSGGNNITTRDRYGNESLGRITSKDFATAEMSRLMYNAVNDRYFNAAGMANSRAMGFNRDDIGDLARVMRPSFGMTAMGDMVQGADGKVTTTPRPEFEKMYHSSMQAGLVGASILRDTFGDRSQEEYARMGKAITGMDIQAPGQAQRMTSRLRELTAMADVAGEDRGSVMQLAAANKIYGQKAYGWGEHFAGSVAHEVTSNSLAAMPELRMAQAEALKRGGYVANVSREEMSSLKETAVGELQREDGGLIEATLHAVQTSPLMSAEDRNKMLSGARAISAGGSKRAQASAIAAQLDTFSQVMGGVSSSNYTEANGGRAAVAEALSPASARAATNMRFQQDNALISDQVNFKMSQLNMGDQPEFFQKAMTGMLSKLDLGTQQQVMGVLGNSSMSAAQKNTALYAPAAGGGGKASGILAGRLMSSEAEAQLAGNLGQVINGGLESQAIRVGNAMAGDPTVKGMVTEESRVRTEAARVAVRETAIKAGEETYNKGGLSGFLNGLMGQGPINDDQALQYAVLRQKNGEKVEGLYSASENKDGGLDMSVTDLEKMQSENSAAFQGVMADMGATSISDMRNKVATRDGASALKRGWETQGGTFGTGDGKMQFLSEAGKDTNKDFLQNINERGILNTFKSAGLGDGTGKITDITKDAVAKFGGVAGAENIAQAGGDTASSDSKRATLVALGRSGNADALPALQQWRADAAKAEADEKGDAKTNKKKKGLQDQLQNLDEAIKAVGSGTPQDLLQQIFDLLTKMMNQGVQTKAM